MKVAMKNKDKEINVVSGCQQKEREEITLVFVITILIITITFIIVIITTACRHIPTMTKSHHGGNMSVIIKVGMCQFQNPTIRDKVQPEPVGSDVKHAPSAKTQHFSPAWSI